MGRDLRVRCVNRCARRDEIGVPRATLNAEEEVDMAVEITPAPDRARLSPVSWPAIFASLAVGISVMLLLTLAGVAVGVSVVDTGTDSPRAITMGAAAWQTISMLVAAIVGGFVAARLSGL